MPEPIQVKGFPTIAEKKVRLPLMDWTIPLIPARLCFLACFKKSGNVFLI